MDFAIYEENILCQSMYLKIVYHVQMYVVISIGHLWIILNGKQVTMKESVYFLLITEIKNEL